MDLHDTIDDEKYDNFNDLLDRTNETMLEENVNNVTVDVACIGAGMAAFQGSYGDSSQPQLTEG